MILYVEGREDEYLRFCQKHGPLNENSPTCPKCGRETILSDITKGQYHNWMFHPEDDVHLDALANGAFKLGLDKILNDLRSGKWRKAKEALRYLAMRPEREAYIAEAAAWFDDVPSTVAFFFSRCSYEKVKPYLNFKYYQPDDKYSLQLFWPLFLEHYKHHAPLSCENCGQQTGNLFIKIRSEKEVLSAQRHSGYATQEVQYSGHAVPHVFCDACALKRADKRKALRALPEAERIRAWMNLNADLNVTRAGDDPGDFGYMREPSTTGFSYEYLITPAAVAEMALNEVDRPVLAAMIECASGVKGELDRIP